MAIPAVPSSASLDTTASAQDSPSSNVTTSDHGDAFAQALNQASAQQGQQETTEPTHSQDTSASHTHSKSGDAEGNPSAGTKDARSSTSSKSTSSKSTSKTTSSDDDKTNSTVDQSDPTTAATTPNSIVTPVVVPDTPELTLPVTADAAAAAAATAAQATQTPVATLTAASGTTPTGNAIDIVLNDPTTTASSAPANTTQSAPGAGQVSAVAANAIALPDQAAFSQALSQVVTQQVAAQTSSLATDAKSIANGTKLGAAVTATDAAGKAVQDLAASLQTNTASTSIADTAAKDVTAPAPSAPLTQLVSVVQPLRAQGNGDYQLTLQLHPDTLGKVEVSVSLHDGQISMQLSSDNADARQMLRESMDDLRQQLESSGLSTGSLDVGTGDTADRQSQAGTNANSNAVLGGGDEMDDAEFFSRLTSVTSVNPSDGSLDVRV